MHSLYHPTGSSVLTHLGVNEQVSRCAIFRRISQFCKQLFEDAQAATTPAPVQEATVDGLTLDVVPRNAHTISRSQISENALKVLYRLHKS